MANCVGRVLTRLARKCQIAVGNALQQYNLTAAEEPVLMAILNHEGFTQEELTAYIGVDKAAASRTVRSLEEKGFLTRVQDPKDKRQNRVYPTDKAREIGPLVRKELYKINLALTEALTQEEDDQVYHLLVRIEENFKP
ncbi:MAG: MarR family transcriptional regulator [Ruminiclostridium sp.]|nr:MarR family transcriptional regulator [Ruminiclostridium sp.]